MSRWLHPSVGIFVSLWLVLLVALQTRPFNDPGSFWHVVVGERILDSGFPHTDEYTFTFAGQHWIPQQWLGEVMMALGHRLAGYDALLLGMSTLLAAFFTWVTLRLMKGGLRWPLAIGIAAFCMVVSAFHFYLRPHIWTIVLMGWTFGWLVDFENGSLRASLGDRAAPTRKRVPDPASGTQRHPALSFAWLIPICMIWTNIHGGMLAFVFTFGLAVAGWSSLWLLGREGPIQSARTILLLSAIVLACLITPIINPFGVDLLNTWWRILSSPVLKQVVPEHTPLNLSRTGDQAVVMFAIFYVFVLIGIRRLPRVTWLLPLVWLGLTVQSIRQGPLFCVVAVVAIADMFPHTVWMRRLRAMGTTLAVPVGERAMDRWTWRAGVIPVALVLSAVLMQTAGVHVPVVGKGWARFDTRYVPGDLLKPLREYARRQPTGTPIFNDALFGGFLIYHTPSLRIAIDDRCELYGDDWLLDYVDLISRHPARIEEWADQYEFTRALVITDSRMDRYLSDSSRWSEVARGRGAVFYRRN